MEKEGYVENGKVKFSDNYIEILSGTTKNGNSLKACLEAIRKEGLIPAKYLPLEGKTWEEYMDPKRVTEDMKKLGKEFNRRFTINYEQLTNDQFLEALKEDMLDVAVFAWPSPEGGIYPKSAGSFNHAVMLGTPDIYAHDNYIPHLKRLATDYNFFPWGYSLSITAQNPFPDEQIALFDVLSRFGLLRFFAEAWKRLVESPKPVVDELFTPKYPTEQPVIPSVDPWQNPTTARHEVRVLCDEAGLKWDEKNLICAVIMGESGFKNTAKNENKINGKTVSIDWGLCQINDHYHIGEGKSFPSVDYVLKNPDKVVRWMIKQYKAGNLGWWICYRSGAYLRYL
jgi:hypothetical protein